MSKKSILLIVWLALLGGLLFGITRFGGGNGEGPSGRGEPSPLPTVTAAQWPQVLAHAAAPPRGGPKARYTIAEFGDFQCPQCRRAWPLLESLLQKYPTQVNVVFVHRPLPNIHQWALSAAEASQIAAAQGRFWPMYDTLYSHQKDLLDLAPALSHKDLPPGVLSRYAAEAGLDPGPFEAALKSHEGQAAVDEASRFADSINIRLTPTLLVYDNLKKTVIAYMGLLPEDRSEVQPDTLYFDRDFLGRLPWLVAPK